MMGPVDCSLIVPRPRALHLAMQLALWLWLGAAAALAQSPVPDDDSVDGLVARGIELRVAGRDHEALQFFARARERDPRSVRVQVHLAMAYQAMGDWLHADEYLSLALRDPDDPYLKRHEQAVASARREIDANVGRLDVEGGPAGAEVRLNGVFLGTLPLAAPVRATVGTYSLEVTLAGHYGVRRPITIMAGSLVRELVQLTALPSEPPKLRAPSSTAVLPGAVLPSAVLPSAVLPGAVLPSAVLPSAVPQRAVRPRRWLTWTLGTLGGVAAATTLGATAYREAHARRWNDDAACLDAGRTRSEVCARERRRVQIGETVALGSGLLSAAFVTGAVLNELAFGAPGRRGLTGGARCVLAAAGATCLGWF